LEACPWDHQTSNVTMNQSSKLAGKVAVVTGASKGIGAAIAKALAAEGASVVVNYSSSKAGADKVVEAITAQGGKAAAVQADVAKKADIERLFAEATKRFGQIDVLVNNAGIYEFSPVEEITEEHFRRQFDVNVLGLILTTQAALKHFKPAGGSIINLSSVVSTLTPPNSTVYSATKAAVDAVADSDESVHPFRFMPKTSPTNPYSYRSEATRRLCG